MAIKVTDQDRGWAGLRDVAGRTATVRVVNKAKNRRGGDAYAAFHESGTKKMRKRPFMTETLEKHGDYVTEMGQAMDRVLAGKDLKASVDEFGLQVKNDMRAMIGKMGLVRTGNLLKKTWFVSKVRK
jgi:hypothetical protein